MRTLLDFTRNTYDVISWPGVAVLMAIESACIPLPSEIIMPLAGLDVGEGQRAGNTWLFVAAFVGAVGNLAGSLLACSIGARGEGLVIRYGRFVLMSPHDLDVAGRWFTSTEAGYILLACCRWCGRSSACPLAWRG
jgi:membrane protein DedA with SNARE-associated domain